MKSGVMGVAMVLSVFILQTAAFGIVGPGARVVRMPGSVTRVQGAGVGRTALTRSAVAKDDDNDYWQGEWICADCGYIYNRRECNGLYFEEQARGYKCPQCGAPRRRFAKKAGDKVGITNDGGDGPILVFSLLGAVLTIGVGIWAAGQ